MVRKINKYIFVVLFVLIFSGCESISEGINKIHLK